MGGAAGSGLLQGCDLYDASLYSSHLLGATLFMRNVTNFSIDDFVW